MINDIIPRQSGNDPIGYLAENFTTFTPTNSQYCFDISSRPTFDVSSCCPVGIFPSPDNNVYVDIDADEEDLNDFVVKHYKNTDTIMI